MEEKNEEVGQSASYYLDENYPKPTEDPKAKEKPKAKEAPVYREWSKPPKKRLDFNLMSFAPVVIGGLIGYFWAKREKSK